MCIGLATVVEKLRGTAWVSHHVYGSWWFALLWALLTAAACVHICRQRLYRRVAVMLLHASFVVILAGALTTHLFARRGTLSLRQEQPSRTYIDNGHEAHRLPFTLRLREFRVVCYPGTDAPLDYQSVISVESDTPRDIVVSMNSIGHVDGYRLFQQGYDSDGQGVTLGIGYDPWGIAVTYAGYLMLLLGIVFTLLSRKTRMRSLYRQATGARAVCIPLLLLAAAGCSLPSTAHGSPSPPPLVDHDIASRMSTIHVLYNNRICPLNTVATDFVTKLSGSASWNGCSADEIFLSWMIYYSPWEQQKIIRVKGGDIQRLLGIDGQWASYADFIDEYNEYKLRPALEQMRSGNGTVDRKSLLAADEKFQVVEMFYRGQMLKMFPFRSESGEPQVAWYSPGGQTLPRHIPVKEQFFIKQAMDFLTESIVTGQKERAFELIAKIKLFQRDMIGPLLPGTAKTKAELLYNGMSSQKWPVFLSLTASLLLCLFYSLSSRRPPLLVRRLSLLFVALLLAWLTLLLGLRWWLSGHVPLSNGHETMLFMAWVLLVLTLLISAPGLRSLRGPGNKSVSDPCSLRGSILLGFGPLAASFCLLVAMLSGGSPQMTPLMPVLASPLLSVHVMTVMCAYALFAIQLLLGIDALALLCRGRDDEAGQLTALSQLLLYPAVFLMAIGIFLGAVWANVSWGTYWSWDPKEAWALITLMVYAVPFHTASLPRFQRPAFYHAYMVLAFLTVMATYFGVNYFLGGLHSYA